MHCPVLPHVAAASCAHSLSGSNPPEIGPQVPSAPAPFLLAEHAWQRLVQDVLQQTPSTQKPDWQSEFIAHWAPFPLRPTQLPPTHEYPLAQSVPVEHVVLQALVPQA